MKVFFDENFSRYLVYALNELEKPYGQIEVFATIDFMAGAPDEDVIKHVANHNGVLFTRDNDFHKQKLLRDIINTNDVGLVYFGMKGSTNWMQVRYVIYNWHLLREHIIKKKKAFAYRIMSDGKGKAKLDKLDIKK